MAVNLRKPTDTFVPREYTPVHIRDEEYPNNAIIYSQTTDPASVSADTTSTADYLLGIVRKSLRMQLGNDLIIDDASFLKDFIGFDITDCNNLVVKNNHIVYACKNSPLSKTYTKVTSIPMLDSIQALLDYLDTSTSTFDGLCDFLDMQWTASTSHPYYIALCDFLLDIKNNNASAIEAVLNGRKSQCYCDLEPYMYTGFTFEFCFFCELNTQIFDRLYKLLKREVEVKVNPLFLFSCLNFSAKLEGDYSHDSDYIFLSLSRSSLQAYGLIMEDNTLIINQPGYSAMRWVRRNSDKIHIASLVSIWVGAASDIAAFTWWGLFKSISSLSDISAFFCSPVGLIPTILFASGCVSAISGWVLDKLSDLSIGNHEIFRMYGGFQYFLNEHQGYLSSSDSIKLSGYFPKKLIKKNVLQLTNDISQP